MCGGIKIRLLDQKVHYIQYVVENQKIKAAAQQLCLLLGIHEKSTQMKIEMVVVSRPSIFEIKPSNFVVDTVNNRTGESPIPML